jgi:hypothetical protein
LALAARRFLFNLVTRVRQREFITLIGGAAISWPLLARAGDRMMALEK